MTAQTLVLSQDYAPVGVVPWQQAITMMWTSKCEVLETYDNEVHSTYLIIKIPAVIRLLQRFRRDKKAVKFSRINVYARDNFECAYCHDRLSQNELTYDHVLPRSKGGKTEWTNIVSCCYECNRKKGNKTLTESGMKLRKQPIRPRMTPAVVIRVSKESAPAAWRDYLYWTGSLDTDDK